MSRRLGLSEVLGAELLEHIQSSSDANLNGCISAEQGNFGSGSPRGSKTLNPKGPARKNLPGETENRFGCVILKSQTLNPPKAEDPGRHDL